MGRLGGHVAGNGTENLGRGDLAGLHERVRHGHERVMLADSWS